jgi:glycosyltransferase involved in cell wall biosynthesis
MQIWLFQTGEPLPLRPEVRKMRTGLLADHLVARGHQVRWWVSAFEHQSKVMLFNRDQEVSLSAGLTLQVLRGCGYGGNISPARYLDHRLVARKFRQQAHTLQPPDVIVTCMPCHHLAFEAVRYGRRRQIPVLVDVRDLWPDIFLAGIKNPVAGRLARRALCFDFQRLHTLLIEADGLIAVSPGYLRWALEKAGRDAQEWDRVFFLGYKALRPGIRHQGNQDLPEWLLGHEGKKLLLYIGTFGVSYEVHLLVEAARRLEAEGREDVCFVLAGAGEQAESLRRESATLRNVLMPGWLDAEEISGLLQLGYLGLLSYTRTAPQGLPNKAFEYLSAGLPLVSSLGGEMAELVDEFGLGLNYRPGDLDGLCQALDTLLDTPGLRNQMSARALVFHQEHGDANTIYEEFAEHIEKLANCRTRRL